MQTTSAEREQFRQGIRAFLQQHSSEGDVRSLMEEPVGYDRTTWTQLAEQLGLPAVLVPETVGGQGLSLAEMAVVVAETGRSLLCAPVFSSSAVATTALLQASSGSGVNGILTSLAAGSSIAVLGAEDAEANPVTATREAGEWQLSGSKTRVLDGQIADLLLVTAAIGESIGLFVVPTSVVGVTRSALSVLDRTRKQSRVTFADASAILLDDDFAAGLARTLDLAAILAAAELLGVADRSLELAVDYALNREQFGVVIGSFQAIKHLLADSLAGVEQMRAAVGAAAELAADDVSDQELAEMASVVKAYCSQTGPKVVETLIQVLGGIGYTWEHPAHLYLRRARSLQMLYGDHAFHRRRLAAQFGLMAA
jgi:alkylation response protein AidB-like acyl-CoA dehydrogenase